MDNLDIQIVDSLTVNLNQEEYSTEGQTLNNVDVYVEDEQQLFETALTQDSINLYTRELPDIINIKEITDGISRVENEIKNTSKESTLIAKVADLKKALNTIDFATIEQAIQNVENITAREATLIQGVGDIIKAVKNIDFTDLENYIAEVKNAVVNIDFSAIAKLETLEQGVQEIKESVQNIDLSDVAKEATVIAESNTIKDKIDAIDIPVTDLTEVAKENTLAQGIASISQKVDNIVIPEVDTTSLAKEGTLTQGVNTISQKIDNIKLQEIVTTNIAKEATLQEILRAMGNSNGALLSLANSWEAMVTNRETLQGYTFVDGSIPESFGDVLARRNLLYSIDDPTIKKMTASFQGLANLAHISMSGLETISVQGAFNGTSIKTITLPMLESITVLGTFQGCTSLKEIYLPKLSYFMNQNFALGDSNLRIVYIPEVSAMTSNKRTFEGCSNLIDLTIGKKLTSSFVLSTWSPSNALMDNSKTLLTQEDLDSRFTSNLQKLLYNIREHIAANLIEAPNTITFSTAVKAAILADQETADAFTNKGWTIA